VTRPHPDPHAWWPRWTAVACALSNSGCLAEWGPPVGASLHTPVVVGRSGPHARDLRAAPLNLGDVASGGLGANFLACAVVPLVAG
jgi:hypothetical protein